jgi:hypothetical protein
VDACCDAISRWLNKQGRLLAKQKLSGHKVAMLQLLEVTLRLPKRVVHRTAQLQAMNGPERRKLRKKWKQLDAAAAQQEHQQRRQEWQQQREAERQQQLVAGRRLDLLRSVQGANQLERTQSFLQQQQQQQKQQQQSWQQSVPDLQQQQEEQQQQLPDVLDPGCGACVEPGSSHNVQQVLCTAAAVLPLQQHQQQQQPQQQHAQQIVQGAAEVQQLMEAPDIQQQQQQQQQQRQVDTCFYQRNWRGKKARQKTRQEKWLQFQQQVQEPAQDDDQQ